MRDDADGCPSSAAQKVKVAVAPSPLCPPQNIIWINAGVKSGRKGGEEGQKGSPGRVYFKSFLGKWKQQRVSWEEEQNEKGIKKAPSVGIKTE